MVITYKNISKVSFPVFYLPNSKWREEDGILFLDEKVLDDRNMAGETLGIRRMQTPLKNLVPIKRSYDDLREIIKSKHNIFIDCKGIPFIYIKTDFVKLKYLHIKRLFKKTTHCVIWVKDGRFVTKRPPDPTIKYVGVLHLEGRPWLLYNYSVTRGKDSRRKV